MAARSHRHRHDPRDGEGADEPRFVGAARSAAGAAVELRGVTREVASYGQRIPVLRGIDLAVGAGEHVAITGPSGSGKSTLLGILGLLDDAYSGTYLFGAADVASMDEATRAKLRLASIGSAFQASHLVPYLSVVDNVALPLHAAGTTLADARTRATELLDAAGLAPRARAKPATLSGGEKRRVTIARALVHRPSLLLVDEPEAGLDPASVERAVELLTRETGPDTTLVIVTHEPAFLKLCERRAVMEDGHLALAH